MQQLKNKDYYDDISGRAKENYRKHFSEHTYIKQMDKVIKEVTDEK